MTVVLIGSGNVSSILARVLTSNGHTIVHVASRKVIHAEALAKEFNVSFSDYSGVNAVIADIYIIAVSDSGIHQCIESLRLQGRLIVHTAGAVSIHILKNVSEQYGVLYPLQSLRKEMKEVPEIPLLIDGNNNQVLASIQTFALSLSDKVHECGDNERLKLHAAAVIVSNFTNHLYTLAESFCTKEQVKFELLKPLIRETADRISSMSPADVQTGPAIRNDEITIERHLSLLLPYPGIHRIYKILTESIRDKEKD